MSTNEKKHPILGNLKFDQYLNWYECKAPFGETEIDIFISLDDVDNEVAIFEQAVEFYKNLEKWYNDAENVITNNLLEEINAGWLPSTRSLLTKPELQELLVLTGITILAHSGFELCYSVGNFLGGHTILVSGSINSGVASADIVG